MTRFIADAETLRSLLDPSEAENNVLLSSPRRLWAGSESGTFLLESLQAFKPLAVSQSKPPHCCLDTDAGCSSL